MPFDGIFVETYIKANEYENFERSLVDREMIL
jgi:hypothetical protein